MSKTKNFRDSGVTKYRLNSKKSFLEIMLLEFLYFISDTLVWRFEFLFLKNDDPEFCRKDAIYEKDQIVTSVK